MFYTTEKNDHGLPHDPFKAIVSPRPIAWVSTLNDDGSANLAPYSFFNGVNDSPPMVMFASQTRKFGFETAKDSARNAREQGEFTVNIVGHTLKAEMNISTEHFDYGIDEFEKAGLTKVEGKSVKCPYVGEAPAALECKTFQVVDLPGGKYELIIGVVSGVHIQDQMLNEGRYDLTRARHVARLGYRDYAQIDALFELNRPDD